MSEDVVTCPWCGKTGLPVDETGSEDGDGNLYAERSAFCDGCGRIIDETVLRDIKRGWKP